MSVPQFLTGAGEHTQAQDSKVTFNVWEAGGAQAGVGKAGPRSLHCATRWGNLVALAPYPHLPPGLPGTARNNAGEVSGPARVSLSGPAGASVLSSPGRDYRSPNEEASVRVGPGHTLRSSAHFTAHSSSHGDRGAASPRCQVKANTYRQRSQWVVRRRVAPSRPLDFQVSEAFRSPFPGKRRGPLLATRCGQSSARRAQPGPALACWALAPGWRPASCLTTAPTPPARASDHRKVTHGRRKEGRFM